MHDHEKLITRIWNREIQIWTRIRVPRSGYKLQRTQFWPAITRLRLLCRGWLSLAWPFSVLLKNRFWLSYCQLSTDLDKILHTTINYCYTEYMAELDRDRRVGGSRRNQNDYVFVILVTHPKSYIETTDRRNFGGKPSKWRCGRVLSWKIPEFCSVGGARSKSIIFRVLGYPSTILRTAYRKQFYPKPMVLMKSRDTEGVPFASRESLWPGIWEI